MRSTTRTQTRGFTLIETSAALALSATLATLAIPSFGPLIERRQVEGVAAQLATDLHFLRTQAVARNQPLRISFASRADGRTCYVLHAVGGAGPGKPASDCGCEASAAHGCEGAAAPIKIVSLPPGRVRIDANVAGIVYDPAYGTSTPAATLRVTGTSGTALHHVVNMMGRVRTCAPQGALSGYRGC